MKDYLQYMEEASRLADEGDTKGQFTYTIQLLTRTLSVLADITILPSCITPWARWMKL